MTAPPPAPRVSLLLVDDSAIIRSCLRQLLGTTPRVSIAGEAATVPEAIERFEELKPDVVILDIQMPGGSGIDVLKWIKSRSPSCLVIMASSCPAHIYAPICREHGADSYFDKSGQLERLVEVLHTILGAATPAPTLPSLPGPQPAGEDRDADGPRPSTRP